MRERLRYLPTVRALFVIGPDGRIRQDTEYPRTPDVSLADRDYFRQYVENPGLQHALPQALQSRSGSGWFVASTRRISGPNGEFGGVAVAAVQLDTVSRLFRKLDLASGQVMSLLHTDGTLIARFPPDDASVGRSYAALPLFTHEMPARRAGTYVTGGAPLDYRRVVSFRALDSQPLVVVFSTGKAAALASWRRAAYGAGAALLAFTALLAGGFVTFAQRQEQRAQALAHRAAETEARALAELNAKFRTFFEQGCFLSCVLALDGTVLEVNHAGLQACGHAREDIVGRKLWDCAWWLGVEGRVRAVREGFAQAREGVLHRCETAYTTCWRRCRTAWPSWRRSTPPRRTAAAPPTWCSGSCGRCATSSTTCWTCRA
jgi:PAS domain S-box-containing protein